MKSVLNVQLKICENAIKILKKNKKNKLFVGTWINTLTNELQRAKVILYFWLIIFDFIFK